MNDAPKQFMDAMIDGNPMLDSDGDGIKDNVDNCRLKANPNQENEDGDAFGDVCDPCPPSQNNTDSDGDGRGNAYYWIAYVPNRSHRGDDGTDVAAIAENKITITPLRIDMTDEPFMTELAQRFAADKE